MSRSAARSLQTACILGGLLLASVAACNGVRVVPIDDDEVDAAADAADDTGSLTIGRICSPAPKPATCGHDPNLPTTSDAALDASTDADVDTDAEADADAAQTDASAAPAPTCAVAARYVRCPAGGNATVSCSSDDGTCPGATGPCTDLCCADEYVASCKNGFVPPSDCRALPSDPGGFGRLYCCKCR